MHLSLPLQSVQPRHSLAHIQLRSRLSISDTFELIKTSSLNKDDSLKKLGIPNLRDCTATVAAETIGQSHAAVLFGGVRLWCAGRHPEGRFGDADVGGECAAAEMAAGDTVADGLKGQHGRVG